MRTHPGQTMTIYDLTAVLLAGIFPFNPQIFTFIDYAPSYVTDRPFETPIADDVIQPNTFSGVFEEPGTQTNANADTSVDIDGWELILRHLQTKQMMTENVPRDGHCLLYAVIRSLETQGLKVLSVEKRCERLLDEVQNNLTYYEEFGTNRQDILTDLNRYVTEKQYNNNTADIVMAALCNSLLITTIVTHVNAATVRDFTVSRTSRINS